MDIIKIARLIEEISYERNTRKFKDYTLRKAVSAGVITPEDAAKLSAEYCTPERCNNPWEYRYTIVYWGELFFGDVPDDYNEIGCNSLGTHWDWITACCENSTKVVVYDNEYGASYDTISGEWS